ncbi:MAG: ChbG/HpnK family deacetylase, partial [Dolichospermum sp.]
MSYLIINADDFGFSHDVNAANIQAHAEGILTSPSLMVPGDAAQEAIALAKNHPHLAVGLHLVLVCGKSVLPPDKIPHLVDSQGNFSHNPTQA